MPAPGPVPSLVYAGALRLVVVGHQRNPRAAARLAAPPCLPLHPFKPPLQERREQHRRLNRYRNLGVLPSISAGIDL